MCINILWKQQWKEKWPQVFKAKNKKKWNPPKKNNRVRAEQY